MYKIDQTKMDLCDKLFEERKPLWDALFKSLEDLSSSYTRGRIVNDKWVRNDHYEPYLGCSYEEGRSRWHDDDYYRVEETLECFRRAEEYANQAWRKEYDHLNEPRRTAEIIKEVQEEMAREAQEKRVKRKRS